MTSTQPLSGKTAIITGSTSGIGLGIAHGLATAGANIMMNGFGDAAEIEENRKAICAHGVECVYDGTDVTDPDGVESMLDLAKSELGNVDIVVNNAGIQTVSPVEDFPVDRWNQIINVNMTSAFYTTRACVPMMKEQGWGRIVNIASAHGLVASPYKSAYVAAKHGMVGFTKTIALELAEDNITANAICPGYVFTPLVEGQIADTAEARGLSEDEVINDVLLKAQATKKFVTVEQIADMVLFLCSDAAENITGASMPIDGGWTAQ